MPTKQAIRRMLRAHKTKYKVLLSEEENQFVGKGRRGNEMKAAGAIEDKEIRVYVSM